MCFFSHQRRPYGLPSREVKFASRGRSIPYFKESYSHLLVILQGGGGPAASIDQLQTVQVHVVYMYPHSVFKRNAHQKINVSEKTGNSF